MSRHFVHRYKYSHSTRKDQFKRMLKEGTAKVLETSKEGWYIELDGKYRVSNKGRFVRET